MPRLDEIISLVESYLPDADLTALNKAYVYAARFQGGKFRLSGEPYLSHPLAVAHILATMRLDFHTVVAGLLHDVLEDETASADEIKELFGKDVAHIVKGTARITTVQFNNQLHFQAENVRRMILAMSADIRVLLVKLADVLHDMHSLKYYEPERQQELARETLDLYAPLASRLGIDWLKRELEDLAFEHLHPKEFRELAAKIKSSSLDRQTYVEEVRDLLFRMLRENNLGDCRILGRPKHLYSIYKKLQVQKIPFEKVYDKVAFRLIFNSIRECYEALGLVHALWRPVPGRFKDFISMPKANLYQSLHTTVVGPHGEFMEIQIRTEEMDKIAQEGIAAHWAYKEKKSVSSKDVYLSKWLKQLVQWHQELKDPQEFLDSVRLELYEPDIYVLTPTGEVKEFPRHSTPIDFAYSIHTEVGNHCTGAKVNGRMVPLKYQLQNGDQVEIITSPHQTPSRDWLSLIKTSRARARIRQWLKQEEQKKLMELGREICERELRKHNLSLKKLVSTGHLRAILKASGVNSLEELMRGVGAGKITLGEIAKSLQPPEVVPAAPVEEATVRKSQPRSTEGTLTIDGLSDMLMKISRCCLPVPGDQVLGFITTGHGISVHKASCPNLLAMDPERWIEVNWAAAPNAVHQAQIQAVTVSRKGILASLSQLLSAEDANILDLEAHTNEDETAIISFILEVENLAHLRRILLRIRQMDGVLDAKRI